MQDAAAAAKLSTKEGKYWWPWPESELFNNPNGIRDSATEQLVSHRLPATLSRQEEEQPRRRRCSRVAGSLRGRSRRSWAAWRHKHGDQSQLQRVRAPKHSPTSSAVCNYALRWRRQSRLQYNFTEHWRRWHCSRIRDFSPIGEFSNRHHAVGSKECKVRSLYVKHFPQCDAWQSPGWCPEPTEAELRREARKATLECDGVRVRLTRTCAAAGRYFLSKESAKHHTWLRLRV